MKTAGPIESGLFLLPRFLRPSMLRENSHYPESREPNLGNGNLGQESTGCRRRRLNKRMMICRLRASSKPNYGFEKSKNCATQTEDLVDVSILQQLGTVGLDAMKQSKANSRRAERTSR
jgi:hypothetical protein